MKDARVLLQHILDSITRIFEYIEGLDHTGFTSDRKTQDAVMRRLAIIGEAVKCLPSNFKKEHGELPWKSIAGFRDVLIHKYFGVDLELLWEVIMRDLPGLEEKLKNILKE